MGSPSYGSMSISLKIILIRTLFFDTENKYYMKTVIPPVEKALLEAELTPEKFVRKTNNGNNLILHFRLQGFSEFDERNWQA